MSYLTKQQLMNGALVLKQTVKTDVGDVRIRELTPGEWVRVRGYKGDTPASETKMIATTVACGVIDEKGARMFSDEDADTLADTMSMSLMREIGDAIITLTLQARSVDDAKKKSAKTKS